MELAWVQVLSGNNGEADAILEELLARTRSFSLDPLHPPRYVNSIFVRRHAELELTAARAITGNSVSA